MTETYKKFSYDQRAYKGKPNGKRIDEDAYWTPDIATAALWEHQTFRGLIWEPACGIGNISKFLDKQVPRPLVLSTDLNDWGYGETGIDFLSANYVHGEVIPNIITNPPYSLANEFLRRALSIATEKVAFLMRLQYLQGVERSEIFEKYRLHVHIFQRRLPFMTSEGVIRRMVAYAWYVFDLTSTKKLMTFDYI